MIKNNSVSHFFGARGADTKQYLHNKLFDHKAWINIHGEDMPEILNWNWNATVASKTTT